VDGFKHVNIKIQTSTLAEALIFSRWGFQVAAHLDQGLVHGGSRPGLVITDCGITPNFDRPLRCAWKVLQEELLVDVKQRLYKRHHHALGVSNVLVQRPATERIREEI
jgi:hypothetical protein